MKTSIPCLLAFALVSFAHAGEGSNQVVAALKASGIAETKELYGGRSISPPEAIVCETSGCSMPASRRKIENADDLIALLEKKGVTAVRGRYPEFTVSCSARKGAYPWRCRLSVAIDAG